MGCFQATGFNDFLGWVFGYGFKGPGLMLEISAWVFGEWVVDIPTDRALELIYKPSFGSYIK